jgi:hypothetical protein
MKQQVDSADTSCMTFVCSTNWPLDAHAPLRAGRRLSSSHSIILFFVATFYTLLLGGCGLSVDSLESGASSGQSVAAATTQQIPSIPLRAFQDSLGINLHMNYTDGLYSNPQQVLEDLQYIGISNVRDNLIEDQDSIPHRQGLAAEEFLADNGIKFDYVVAASADFQDAIAQPLNYFNARHPNGIASIEGPNEINNFPVAGPGSNEHNAIAFQMGLCQFVKSTSGLSSIPVFYFTGGSQVSLSSVVSEADFPNTHPYAHSGQQPYGWIVQNLVQSFTDAMPYPSAITETGYSTALQGNWDAVDEPTQASMILNDLFDAALLGSTRTYLYQLLEAYPNYATNADTAFGIFHYTDGSPKLAAIALHNLSVSIPRDEVSSPQTVSGVLTGLSASTGKAVALTGSDGSIYLALWDEQTIWNPSTQTALNPSTQSVSVSIAGKWNVSFFDPETGSSVPLSPSTGSGSSLYTAPVTTHVTFLVFHPTS